MSQTCLLTLRHSSRHWDLELPATVPCSELVDLLQVALALPKRSPNEDVLRLYLEPFGAVLQQRQSLSEAGVFDGAILLLSSTAPRGSSAVADAVGDSPAVGWMAPAEEKKLPAPADDQPGFRWKKLPD